LLAIDLWLPERNPPEILLLIDNTSLLELHRKSVSKSLEEQRPCMGQAGEENIIFFIYFACAFLTHPAYYTKRLNTEAQPDQKSS
jgi:hypothetical protein